MMPFANTRRATNVSLTVAMLLILALATACGGGAFTGNSGNNGNGGSGNTTPPPPASSVVVTPSNATVYAGQKIGFTAAVNGTTDQTVTWSVNGVAGGNSTLGTIDVNGAYQSPVMMPTLKLGNHSRRQHNKCQRFWH